MNVNIGFGKVINSKHDRLCEINNQIDELKLEKRTILRELAIKYSPLKINHVVRSKGYGHVYVVTNLTTCHLSKANDYGYRLLYDVMARRILKSGELSKVNTRLYGDFITIDAVEDYKEFKNWSKYL
jgi:hypothetical protein